MRACVLDGRRGSLGCVGNTGVALLGGDFVIVMGRSAGIGRVRRVWT